MLLVLFRGKRLRGKRSCCAHADLWDHVGASCIGVSPTVVYLGASDDSKLLMGVCVGGGGGKAISMPG
jgi:hypothetical protein